MITFSPLCVFLTVYVLHKFTTIFSCIRFTAILSILALMALHKQAMHFFISCHISLISLLGDFFDCSASTLVQFSGKSPIPDFFQEIGPVLVWFCCKSPVFFCYRGCYKRHVSNLLLIGCRQIN